LKRKNKKRSALRRTTIPIPLNFTTYSPRWEEEKGRKRGHRNFSPNAQEPESLKTYRFVFGSVFRAPDDAAKKKRRKKEKRAGRKRTSESGLRLIVRGLPYLALTDKSAKGTKKGGREEEGKISSLIYHCRVPAGGGKRKGRKKKERRKKTWEKGASRCDPSSQSMAISSTSTTINSTNKERGGGEKKRQNNSLKGETGKTMSTSQYPYLKRGEKRGGKRKGGKEKKEREIYKSFFIRV